MSDQLPLESISKTKRLSILTSAELDDLYSRPQLTDDERIWLFELNQEEQLILSSKTSVSAKVDAIIRLDYFKQNPQFFQFDLAEIIESGLEYCVLEKVPPQMGKSLRSLMTSTTLWIATLNLWPWINSELVGK